MNLPYQIEVKMLRFFIILLLFIPNLFQATSRTEFYLNPTLNNFLTEVSLEENEYRSSGFILASFIKYPSIMEEALKNLSNYNKHLKNKIIQGIVNLNDNKAYKIISKNYSSIINSMKPSVNMNFIDNIKFNDNPKNLKELNSNINNIDLLWGTLFATGDKKYLEKILQSIQAAPLNVKMLALELVHHEAHSHLKEKAIGQHYNPDYEQVLKYISEITKLNKFQIMNYYLILDSLEQEIHNHTDLRNKLNQIVSLNKNYNYYKDLNLM